MSPPIESEKNAAAENPQPKTKRQPAKKARHAKKGSQAKKTALLFVVPHKKGTQPANLRPCLIAKDSRCNFSEPE